MKFSSIARWLVVVVIVAGVGYLVYGKINRSEKKQAANSRQGAAPKDMLVDGYVVRSEKLNNALEASGTLQSNEETSLISELNARIVHINFREGQSATKGQVLIKLYDADLRATLEKLKTQKQLAEKTLERQKYLLNRGGVSQQEVDVNVSQVEAFNADIAFAEAQLQKTEIRAPFNGYIGLRYISEGTLVTPTTVIATFQQTNPLKLDFSVPEKYSNLLKTGDDVSFTVASDQSTHHGTVYAVEPRIDPNTRTIRLRAHITNPNNQLHPGLFARVELKLSSVPQALMVPTQAIIPSARDKKVIVAKAGKAEFVTVETGERDANKIQIIKGLSAGDTIVISGLLQLKPDAALKVSRVQN